MAYATTGDLEARWRPLSTAEASLAQVLLEDASARLRASCPHIDVRVEGGKLDPDVPRQVVCAMVKRAMLAPADQGAAAAVQQTAGPFSRSTTFVNPTGDLYVTKAELRLLGCGRQRAFSVDTIPPP